MKSSKIKEIPGFYFDYEKNRYFPITNAHNKVYSDYWQEKNKQLLLKQDQEQELERKLIKSENNVEKPCNSFFSIFESNINSFTYTPSYNNFKSGTSCFYILGNKKFLSRNESLLGLKLFDNRINQKEMQDLCLKDLKIKYRDNKYESFFFNDKNFVFTLDYSGLDKYSKIYIDLVEMKNKNNLNHISSNCELSQIREIKLKYIDKQFNSFKILKNFLTSQWHLNYQDSWCSNLFVNINL